MFIVTRSVPGKDSDGALQSVSRAMISCEGNSLPEIASVAARSWGPSVSQIRTNSESRESNSAFHSSLIGLPGGKEQARSSDGLYSTFIRGRVAWDEHQKPNNAANKNAFRITRIGLPRPSSATAGGGELSQHRQYIS